MISFRYVKKLCFSLKIYLFVSNGRSVSLLYTVVDFIQVDLPVCLVGYVLDKSQIKQVFLHVEAVTSLKMEMT